MEDTSETEKKYSKQRDEHTYRLLSGKGFSMVWNGNNRFKGVL